MKHKKLYSYQDHLKESLQDKEFRTVYEQTEPEYVLAKQLIEARLKNKLSQRDMAKKLNTSQAVISRIESMDANPTLGLLKRIAAVLNTRLTVRLG